MIPNGLQQHFLKFYNIDIAQYDIAWNSLIKKEVQSKIKEGASWETTFLFRLLSKRILTLAPHQQDSQLELITHMILHHLTHGKNSGVNIMENVLEALTQLSNKGTIDISEKYWLRLEPELSKAIIENMPSMFPEHQGSVLNKLYQLPQYWLSMPETVWVAAQGLAQSDYLDEIEGAMSLLVAGAPSKYLTPEIYEDGLPSALRASDGVSLISVDRLIYRMQYSPRPLALWCEMNTMQLAWIQQHELLNTSELLKRHAKLLAVLKDYPFDATNEHTWQVWSQLDEITQVYVDTPIETLVKNIRTSNREIEQAYAHYAPIAKSIAASILDEPKTIFYLYMARTNPQEHTIEFEVSP